MIGNSPKVLIIHIQGEIQIQLNMVINNDNNNQNITSIIQQFITNNNNGKYNLFSNYELRGMICKRDNGAKTSVQHYSAVIRSDSNTWIEYSNSSAIIRDEEYIDNQISQIELLFYVLI